MEYRVVQVESGAWQVERCIDGKWNWIVRTVHATKEAADAWLEGLRKVEARYAARGVESKPISTQELKIKIVEEEA